MWEGPAPSGKKANTKAKKNNPLVPTTIELKEFVPLARAISESEPPVEVPRTIIQTLKNVIAKRRECAAWFEKQNGDQRHQSSVGGHAYFITVLEVVLGLLLLKISQETTNSSKQASVEDEKLTLANAFEGLDVEEAFSDDEVPVASSKTGMESNIDTEIKPSKKSKDNDFEDSTFVLTVEDLSFISYCFYDDLEEIRSHIKEIWAEYKNGKIDLMTASVVTDTAFDLIQRAEVEFLVHLPAFIGISDYMKSIGRVVEESCGVRRFFSCYRSDDIMNMEYYM